MVPDAVDCALQSAYQEKRALIAGLSDADLARGTSNPKWNVRLLAAHLATEESGTMYVGKRLARGRNARPPAFVVNLSNWWSARRNGHASVPQLLALLDKEHAACNAWLQTLPAEAFDRGGLVLDSGRTTLRDFLLQSGEHVREHAAEINAALAR